MSRRARALGFLLAAMLAAATAATIADGYGDSVVRGYGELRPVLVASSDLAAGKRIDPGVAAEGLEVRRVPVRFAPPGALAAPAEAVGLVPGAPIPAGSYLLAAQLRPPSAASPVAALGGGRRPVEIAVSGAGALAAVGASPVGSRVDVAVTTEPSGSGEGRTYVAAPAVPLLGLGPGGEGVEGETATATLALTRRQALRLIDAESFARRITLIPPRLMDVRERNIAELSDRLRERLVERRRAEATTGSRSEEDLEQSVRRLVDEQAAVLPLAEREEVAARIIRDSVGLGPLEVLLADPAVEEVMVNGFDRVYVERRGLLEKTDVRFDDEEDLRNAIERILAPLGRRVDELSPMVDARLADGSRVNVVIPPLAIDGPTVSIRRFGANRPGPDRLVEIGTLTAEQRALLEEAVGSRRSVLVSGGTGSGKTTLLNALSSFIAPSERVVTIEDAAELRLQQPHVVRLESRPAGVEGQGEVTIRDLLRNALRMRPDRIVIGEVRGVEALDLLTALNTGHDGALSTVHANSPDDALRRLETLALMAGVGLPHAAIAEQVQRGIGLVVHLQRRSDGSRRVTEIATVG